MKIALFLNSDIHCAKALELLGDYLNNHQVKIILSQKVGKVDALPSELVEVQKLEKCDIQKKFSYQFSSYKKINSDYALEDLRKFSPDVMISIRFGQIFKNPDLINLAPFGILNLHSGILPNYRGIMASFWAILSGDKTLGTTLHYITDSGIDTGGIIGFSKSEIDWNLPLVKNINNIYRGGCDLILQTLDKIFAGEKINVTDQKTLHAGNYFSYPKSDEIKRFLDKMPLV